MKVMLTYSLYENDEIWCCINIKIQFLLINPSLSGYLFDISGRRYMFIKEFKGS